MTLRALNYLWQHKIPASQDIAVMGFNDIDAALSLDLTTYNFNDMQGAKAMIGQILGMPTMPGGVREKVISIPGFVISRKTL